MLEPQRCKLQPGSHAAQQPHLCYMSELTTTRPKATLPCGQCLHDAAVRSTIAEQHHNTRLMSGRAQQNRISVARHSHQVF